LILSEVDRVLTISPFASLAAQRLFGKPIISWGDLELLFEDSQLSSDQFAQLVASIVSTLGGSLLNFEINQDSFPSEVRRMSQGEIQQIFLCRWLPLERNDEVREILLILIDVTRERIAAQRAEVARSSTERLLQIAALDPKSFSTFLREVDHLIERTQKSLREPEQDAWLHILRDIHTIKGLTRNFGLLHLSADVHTTETGLLSLPANEDRFIRGAVIVESLRDSLQIYKDQARQIGYLEEIGPQLSRDLQVSVYRWGQKLLQKADPSWLQQWSAFLKNHFNSNHEVIDVLNQGLTHIAEEVDKPCPAVTCEGPTFYLYREPSEILIGALTHIFRNCLDHGIESEMERIRLNKDPVGTIVTRWQYRQRLHLTIIDDGRGLNLAKIRERAIEKGLLGPEQELSDSDLAELIFSQGFSTKDSVSSISGRGVGMDAVRASLAELAGSIQIIWTGPRNRLGFRPCAWSIDLPGDVLVQEEESA
jgi:two-component system chemotaxis sensor kinase CheA